MTDPTTSSERAPARYRLRRELASGGMATVHLAEDVVLDRPVALKVLNRDLAADPAFVDRFRREAQAAGRLRHPNIVTVYDWGPIDGSYYIAMEFVEGRTLRDVLTDDGPLSAREAAGLAGQIVEALDAAHQEGLVHRDIKPSNIIVSPDNRIKITDFGIARAARGGLDLTQVGMIVGTAAYLSPEQARGTKVDPRSDLYALGVVLFEMTTGRLPFRGDGPLGYATQHVTTPPPRLRSIRPSLPIELDELVDRLLAKDPDDRYQTAVELALDLRKLASGAPNHPSPAPDDRSSETDRREIRPVNDGSDAADGRAPVGLAPPIAATEVMPSSLRPDHRPQPRGDGPPTRPSRRGLLPIVIAVLVVGVVGALLWLSTLVDTPGSDEPEQATTTSASAPSTTVSTDEGSPTVVVPNVEGMAEADADRALTDAGLVITTEAIDVDDPDLVGRVVAQDPQQGQELAEGSAVVVRVGRQRPDETTTTSEPSTTTTTSPPPETEASSTTTDTVTSSTTDE